MPDVDPKLAGLLRQAKTTPLFFAFVVKGATDGVLLVDKKKISSSAIDHAKKACGGTQVFHGRCGGDDEALVFEVGKEPPGTLASQVKAVIRRDAGLTVKVEFRFAADLAEGEAKVTTPGESSSPGPEPDDLSKTYLTRLKALAPLIDKADDSGNEVAKELKLQLARANQLHLAKEHKEADEALDQLEAILKRALLSEPKGGDLKKAYEKRLAALNPLLQQALQKHLGKTEHMGALRAFAQQQVQEGDYHAAVQALDKLEGLLKEAAKAITSGGKGSLVKQRQFMLTRWARIRAELKAELAHLIHGIAQKQADSNPVELGTSLDEYLGDLLTEIQDDIDAGINAGNMNMFPGLRARVEQDTLLTHLLAAPVIDGSKFKQTILTAMSEIESALTA